jgi:hypothetical protein
MVRYGPALDKQQLLLGRLAEIGAELFVIASSASRAQAIDSQETYDLADCVFENAKLRISQKFKDLNNNNDKKNYSLARKVLESDYKFLEGIV